MGPGNLLKPRHINPLDTDVNRITTIFLLTLQNAESRANIVRIYFYLLSGGVRIKEDVKVWAEEEDEKNALSLLSVGQPAWLSLSGSNVILDTHTESYTVTSNLSPPRSWTMHSAKSKAGKEGKANTHKSDFVYSMMHIYSFDRAIWKSPHGKNQTPPKKI